jgi:lambda family phage portal protein
MRRPCSSKNGIKPSSLIADSALKAAVQRLWLDWTDESDAEGFTDFYGQQRHAAREVFIAGEVFLRFRPRRPEDGLAVPLQIQMLPSEMLPLHLGLPSRSRDGDPGNERAANGNVIRQGIEFDRIGRRVAYHFLRRHAGDVTDPGLPGETVRVPAAEVIHVIDPVDAGQLRGISRFAPGIVKLFLLDQYDDAEQVDAESDRARRSSRSGFHMSGNRSGLFLAGIFTHTAESSRVRSALTDPTPCHRRLPYPITATNQTPPRRRKQPRAQVS